MVTELTVTSYTFPDTGLDEAEGKAGNKGRAYAYGSP